MAARKDPKVDARHREAIQTTQLIKRLQLFALTPVNNVNFAKVEMTPTQVRSALGILAKSLPDLVAATLDQMVDHRYVAEMPSVCGSGDEWRKMFSPVREKDQAIQ